MSDDPEVPGYVLETLLGEGGMGRVYRARRESDGLDVAVKVMHGGFEAKEIRRLANEADVQGRVRSDFVPGLVEFRDDPQRPVLVMEYVEGRPLDDVLARCRDPRERGEILKEVLPGVIDGLRALHGEGAVHRDLKPENILVRNSDGAGVLLDLGLAKADYSPPLTATGFVMGTPAYMAPEQIAGKKEFGPETDLYQVALILLRGMEGDAPDGFEEGIQDAMQRAREGVRRVRERVPELSPGLVKWIGRATDPEIFGRGSAAEGFDELERLLEAWEPRKSAAVAKESLATIPVPQERIDGPASGGGEPTGPVRARRPGLWVGGALVVLVGLVVGLTGWPFWMGPSAEETEAMIAAFEAAEDRAWERFLVALGEEDGPEKAREWVGAAFDGVDLERITRVLSESEDPREQRVWARAVLFLSVRNANEPRVLKGDLWARRTRHGIERERALADPHLRTIRAVWVTVGIRSQDQRSSEWMLDTFEAGLGVTNPELRIARAFALLLRGEVSSSVDLFRAVVRESLRTFSSTDGGGRESAVLEHAARVCAIASGLRAYILFLAAPGLPVEVAEQQERFLLSELALHWGRDPKISGDAEDLLVNAGLWSAAAFEVLLGRPVASPRPHGGSSSSLQIKRGGVSGIADPAPSLRGGSSIEVSLSEGWQKIWRSPEGCAESDSIALHVAERARTAWGILDEKRPEATFLEDWSYPEAAIRSAFSLLVSGLRRANPRMVLDGTCVPLGEAVLHLLRVLREVLSRAPSTLEPSPFGPFRLASVVTLGDVVVEVLSNSLEAKLAKGSLGRFESEAAVRAIRRIVEWIGFDTLSDATRSGSSEQLTSYRNGLGPGVLRRIVDLELVRRGFRTLSPAELRDHGEEVGALLDGVRDGEDAAGRLRVATIWVRHLLRANEAIRLDERLVGEFERLFERLQGAPLQGQGVTEHERRVLFSWIVLFLDSRRETPTGIEVTTDPVLTSLRSDAEVERSDPELLHRIDRALAGEALWK